MNDKQHDLAAVIRAEAAANRITAKELQHQVGVSSSAWSNYFVACTRDVPMSVVVAVAEALKLTASELMARAEARAASGSPSVDRTKAELEAGLSQSDRDLLDRLRAEREAGEVLRDPSGRPRADQDDGIGRTASWFGRTA